MSYKLAPFAGLVIAIAFAAGCSKPPASQPPTNQKSEVVDDGVNKMADVEAGEPVEEQPADRKFVCHLDCSGTEAKAYGTTEAEARANVSTFVETNCKPEDGQHFIFCDPLD